MRKIHLLAVLCSLTIRIAAQEYPDTSHVLELNGIEISTPRNAQSLGRLNEIHGQTIIASKKTELIDMSKVSADLASGAHRQVFARVPGLMLWESDGSGIQIGISARGLSPNRSWEFNNRQNGYDISPDVFGYPEAYYTPPLEALKRIEIIRGAASLQFGPQFGGMVNYVLKDGKGNKPFFYEGRQSIGSYQLADSYNAIGGARGKWNYYGFVQQRSGSGWRENSTFRTQTAFVSAEYHFSEKCSIGMNVTHSEVLSQQPGGLTQEQYEDNWRQSSRSRNWLSVPWNVGALYSEIQTSAHSTLSLKLFGVIATRSSVGFLKAINIADTINAEINAYNFRKLDIDSYQSWGAEARWLLHYRLGLNEAHLSTGVRYSDAHTHRQVDGLGSTGREFDDQLAQGEFGKNLRFYNINNAYFAENIFHFGKKLTLTPGIRIEQLHSQSSGYISQNAGEFAPIERSRFIPMGGIGAEYKFNQTSLYANFAQAYRPVTYSELTPAGTTDVIDPNLKDASGFNFDGGWRGRPAKGLNMDISMFYLVYDNRIGTIQKDGANFKTNIGTSVSKGLELFLEMLPVKMMRGYWSAFAAACQMDARYTHWENPEIADNPETAIVGKRVEYAPQQTCRIGVDYKRKRCSFHTQWSYVGEVFTDAVNTVESSSNFQSGKLPSYSLWDASMRYYVSDVLNLQLAANNLLDTRYATRRAGGYPGPGLLPGNGRSITLTLSVDVGVK